VQIFRKEFFVQALKALVTKKIHAGEILEARLWSKTNHQILTILLVLPSIVTVPVIIFNYNICLKAFKFFSFLNQL